VGKYLKSTLADLRIVALRGPSAAGWARTLSQMALASSKIALYVSAACLRTERQILQRRNRLVGDDERFAAEDVLTRVRSVRVPGLRQT
jgi:hypothetical protein